MIKIIENMEIPSKRRHGNSVYPFADLEIGQGFVVDGDNKKRTNILNSARSWGLYRGKPIKLKTSIVDGRIYVKRVA